MGLDAKRALSFGRLVKRRREHFQMSQETLATSVGISRNYLSLIERGKALDPAWSIVLALSETLQFSTVGDLTIEMETQMSCPWCGKALRLEREG